jgi:hypothetical protein
MLLHRLGITRGDTTRENAVAGARDKGGTSAGSEGIRGKEPMALHRDWCQSGIWCRCLIPISHASLPVLETLPVVLACE